MEEVSGWKKLKAGALGVIALAALMYAFSYGRFVNMTYPNRTFSADGEGEIESVPDLARFTASVVSQGGKNVAEVQKANTDKMNRVNEYLKGQGIDKKDLKTGQYQLNPRYSYSACENNVCPPPTITGYDLMQALDVKVRDTEKLGDLLSGVVDQGANQVSDVRFTVDDEDKVRAEAREQAIKKAKEKATAIAKASGFGVGRIVSIYEDAGPMPYGVGIGGGDSEMLSSAKAAPVIEPGTEKNTVRVTMTFEIED